MLLITLFVGFLSPFTAFAITADTLPVITLFKHRFVDVFGARKSKKLQLECIATGNPAPEIDFQLNGFSLINKSQLSTTRATFWVNNVTYKDNEGQYRCVARNEHGRVFKSLDIKIPTIGRFFDGQRFQDPIEQIPVTIGLPKEFFCPKHTHAYPVKYLWRYAKVGHFLQENRNRMLLKGGALFYSHVTQDDVDDVNEKGGLSCVLLMGEDHVSSVRYKFQVVGVHTNDVAPSIQRNFPSVSYVPQKEDITLVCVTTGNPTPNISWFHNGVNINSNNTNYGVNPYIPAKLTINNVMDALAGNYKCVAKNRVAQAEMSGLVIVASPAKLTKKLKTSKAIQKDEQLRLQCPASGTETIKYEWFRNGSLLSSYTLGKVSMKIEDGVLEINSVKYNDAGTYQCFVSNKYGSDSSAIDVKVKAPKLVNTINTPRKTTETTTTAPLKLQYIIIIACASVVFVIVIAGALLVFCRTRRNKQNNKGVVYVPTARPGAGDVSEIDTLPLPPKSLTESDDENEDFRSTVDAKSPEYIDLLADLQGNLRDACPERPEHLYYPDTRSGHSTLSTRSTRQHLE